MWDQTVPDPASGNISLLQVLVVLKRSPLIPCLVVGHLSSQLLYSCLLWKLTVCQAHLAVQEQAKSTYVWLLLRLDRHLGETYRDLTPLISQWVSLQPHQVLSHATKTTVCCRWWWWALEQFLSTFIRTVSIMCNPMFAMPQLLRISCTPSETAC